MMCQLTETSMASIPATSSALQATRCVPWPPYPSGPSKARVWLVPGNGAQAVHRRRNAAPQRALGRQAGVCVPARSDNASRSPKQSCAGTRNVPGAARISPFPSCWGGCPSAVSHTGAEKGATPPIPGSFRPSEKFPYASISCTAWSVCPETSPHAFPSPPQGGRQRHMDIPCFFPNGAGSLSAIMLAAAMLHHRHPSVPQHCAGRAPRPWVRAPPSLRSRH